MTITPDKKYTEPVRVREIKTGKALFQLTP